MNIRTSLLISVITLFGIHLSAQNASPKKTVASKEVSQQHIKHEPSKVRELDAKIQQKERQLRALTQEISKLKIQRVKAHATEVNTLLNNKQRSFTEDQKRASQS